MSEETPKETTEKVDESEIEPRLSWLFRILGAIAGATFAALATSGGLSLALPDIAWIEIVEKFQTLIAATFGFVGIIVAGVMTARFARQMDKAQHQREVRSLAVALKTEIGAISIMAEGIKAAIADMIKDAEDDTQEIHSDVVTGLSIGHRTIYEANAVKIGLLPERAAFDVVSCYSAVDLYEKFLMQKEVSDAELEVLDDIREYADSAMTELEKVFETEESD